MGNGKILIILSILLISAASAKLYLNYNASVNINEAKNLRDDLKVLLYTKNMCKYCILAKEFLDDNSIPYEAIDLENNRDLHRKLVDQTRQETVPYVYINDKFIGGYTELEEFKKSGKLYIETDFKQ